MTYVDVKFHAQVIEINPFFDKRNFQDIELIGC